MNYLNKNSVWAIMPEALEAFLEMYDSLEIDADALDKEAYSSATAPKKDKIVVLPIHGTIVQKEGIVTKYLGGTSTETFGAWVDYFANEPTVSRIIIDINSGGGSVYGVKELADKIYKAREKKPIVAVCNSLMASAAYWIGSAADKIYCTPSGEAGSIGVILLHSDFSEYEKRLGVKTTIIKAGKHKGEGNPFEPLSDETKDYLQKNVDDYYAMFTADIAKNRSTTKADVISNYGEGRVLTAKDALSIGMIDGIKTLEEVVNMKQIRLKSKKTAQAELDLRRLK